jgi:glycosyltransferase involved in cell wall biosynthesis
VAVVLGRVPKGQLRFYGRIARLYATSTEVAAQAAAQCPAMRERIRVIWNPIDWALHAAAGAARGGGAVTIGFAGRLHPEKGIELLLRAAVRLAARSDLPAWRLDLIGPAAVREGGGGEAWRDSLASRFGTALGPRLAFHPAQFAPEKLARFYGAVDIFCYPSLAERGETFGVAVAEAMAAGAAPVVSALACFGDLVRDGETGLVFDHRAADADVLLAAALARLILEGPLRRALGARAQVHVRRFDYPEIAAAILNDLGKLAPPG